MVVRMAPGSTVRIVENSAARRTRVPLVRASDFREGLKTLGYPAIGDDLAGFGPGVAMQNTFDLRDGRYVWAIGEEATMTRSDAITVLCGEFVSESPMRNYGFFRARSAGALTGR